MREILFKAKTIEEGKWIEGYYTEVPYEPLPEYKEFLREKFITIENRNKYKLQSYITTLCNSINKVIPETVCQYTGLKDKNGKKIFENDLLKPPSFIDDEQRPCLCIYNQGNNVNEVIGFGLYRNNSYFSKCPELVCSDEWDEFEVIGNKFDDGELIC